MAESHLPPYSNNELARVSDLDMIDILKEIIDEIMIENRIYYDDNDRAKATEVIYPLIAIIVFNSNFSEVRSDKKKLLELITYLVTNLS